MLGVLVDSTRFLKKFSCYDALDMAANDRFKVLV